MELLISWYEGIANKWELPKRVVRYLLGMAVISCPMMGQNVPDRKRGSASYMCMNSETSKTFVGIPHAHFQK